MASAELQALAKPIPGELADVCTQFLTNLFASDYRIISPDGVDITGEAQRALLAEATMRADKAGPRG